MNLMEEPIQKPVMATLFVTVFLDYIGFTITLPYLYFLLEGLGGSVVTYGAVVMSFSLMQVIFMPIFGRLSDRYGRREILIIALFGTSASYLLLAFSNAVWLLVISRMLSGAFSGSYTVVQAYISDSTNKDSRLKYFGFIAAANAFGYIIGPVLGGGLSDAYGYPTPAFLAFTIAIANAIVTYAVFPRTHPPKTGIRHIGHPSEHGILQELVRRKELSLLFIINFVESMVFVLLLVIVPPWLNALFGFGSFETGVIISYAAAVSVLSFFYILPKLSRHLSTSMLVMTGLITISAGFLSLSLVHDGSPLTLAFVVAVAGTLSFGFSIAGPAINTLVTITAPSKKHGTTLGIARSTGGIASVIAPIFGTAFFSLGASLGILGLGFAVGTLISTLGLSLVLLLRRPSYLGTWEQFFTRKSTLRIRTAVLEKSKTRPDTY